MLFAKPVTSVTPSIKRRKKTKKYVYWTAGDIARLNEIENAPKADKKRIIKQFSVETGHSVGAVINKIYRLKSERKQFKLPTNFGLLN